VEQLFHDFNNEGNEFWVTKERPVQEFCRKHLINKRLAELAFQKAPTFLLIPAKMFMYLYRLKKQNPPCGRVCLMG
jgi:hypothetical protein